jgi:hypothetical protein
MLGHSIHPPRAIWTSFGGAERCKLAFSEGWFRPCVIHVLRGRFVSCDALHIAVAINPNKKNVCIIVGMLAVWVKSRHRCFDAAGS